MAGKTPGATAPAGRGGRGERADLANTLRAAGLLKAPSQLNKISQSIIKNMRAAGFDGGGKRGVEGQLKHAVTQFQRANDLPQTGRLDQPTVAALKDQGLLTLPGQQRPGGAQARGEGRAPVGAQRGQAPPPAARDGYAKATQNKILPQQPRNLPRAAGEKSGGENFLSFLANLLKGTLGVGKGAGGAGGNAAGGAEGGAEAGAQQQAGAEAGRGAPQEARPQEARAQQQARPQETREARQDARQQEAKPQEQRPQEARAQAGRGAQAGGSAREAAATVAKPAIQARADGQPAQAAAPGVAAAQSRAAEQQRVVSTTATQDPTQKGLTQDEGDLDALEGQGKKVGERSGRGEDGEDEDGAPEEADGEGGVGLEEEADATERDVGNATSGTEHARDLERGHATLDDGSEAEAGYYEIPPLSQQLREALSSIEREAGRDHKTTTYRWELTLYRPAIYGAGQKAQELLHLVVDEATAYDEVWQRARDEVNKHLRRLEPDAAPLELEDFVRALQRARVAGED